MRNARLRQWPTFPFCVAALALPVLLGGCGGASSKPSASKTSATTGGHPSSTSLGSSAGTSTSASPGTGTSSTASQTTAALTGQVLAPATTAPVVGECSMTLTYSADGGASPLFCPDGGINIPAWNWYSKAYRQLMGVGPDAVESDLIEMMCSDRQGTYPTLESASKLAARYYGWKFASDPAFAHWPFYPQGTNECPGAE
jgi:hypothetical protein